MPLQRAQYGVGMIGHDAPGEQAVRNTVEVGHRIANQSGDSRVTHQA